MENKNTSSEILPLLCVFILALTGGLVIAMIESVKAEKRENKLKTEIRELSLQVYGLQLDTIINGSHNRFRDRLDFISDSMLIEQFKNINNEK